MAKLFLCFLNFESSLGRIQAANWTSSKQAFNSFIATIIGSASARNGMELPPHKDNFICSSIHPIVTRGLSKINNCLFRFFFWGFLFYFFCIFTRNFFRKPLRLCTIYIPTPPPPNNSKFQLPSNSPRPTQHLSLPSQLVLHLRISALTPAIEVHHLPERLIGLCPPLLSVPDESAEIWVTCARDRSDIRRIPAGGEPPLTDLKRSGAGLPLASLIGVAIHHRHARRHPNPIQITHPEYSNSR